MKIFPKEEAGLYKSSMPYKYLAPISPLSQAIFLGGRTVPSN